MGYSNYLASRHDIAKKLVDKLSETFTYVSLLGSHVTGTAYATSKRQTSINETRERDCGFVPHAAARVCKIRAEGHHGRN